MSAYDIWVITSKNQTSDLQYVLIYLTRASAVPAFGSWGVQIGTDHHGHQLYWASTSKASSEWEMGRGYPPSPPQPTKRSGGA